MPAPHLDVSNGVTDDTYNSVSLDEHEAIFRMDTSTLSNPDTLRVSHTPAGDDEGLDRHLVSFQCVRDDTDGLPRTATVHAVLSIPRKAITQTDVDLLYTRLKDVLDTHMASIVGGFIPMD